MTRCQHASILYHRERTTVTSMKHARVPLLCTIRYARAYSSWHALFYCYTISHVTTVWRRDVGGVWRRRAWSSIAACQTTTQDIQCCTGAPRMTFSSSNLSLVSKVQHNQHLQQNTQSMQWDLTNIQLYADRSYAAETCAISSRNEHAYRWGGEYIVSG